MANQTVTTDLTLAQVIANGLNDGENITINSGAVVTATQAPTVLIGQISINDGELFLDGENATEPIVFVGERAEEINVNGAGTLRASLGWWEFPTTSDGTADQTFDASTYFTDALIDEDVFSGVWVETGRRINYDGGSGVPPVVGDWVFLVSDTDVHGRIDDVSGDGVSGYVVVRFLTGAIADNAAIEIHSIQENRGPDYQKSWNALANGADVFEADVFQEFGNVFQNSTDFLTQMGSGIAGFGYSQSWQNNTLTFGDGTNGFIPPDTARIRVPMVHVATATIASIAINESVMDANGSNRYELETVNGGDCFLSGVSMGSAQFEDNLGNDFQASYCAANLGFGVYGALQRTTYDHCIFVTDHVFDLRGAPRSMPAIVDLVLGADVRDCLSVSMNDVANTTEMGCQTSFDINMERCIQIGISSATEIEFTRSTGLTIHDLVVIGTQLVFTTIVDLEMTLFKSQRNLTSGVAGNDQIICQANCADFRITGWEVFQGSRPDDSMIVVNDSTNMKVRGFHFIEDKFDNEGLGGTQGEEFVAVGGLCSDITIARCWIDRGTPNEFATIAAGTTKNLTILNCSGEYNGEIDPDGINTSMRGIHGGSGSLGASTGLETDYPGTAGAHCGDVFESPTAGYIFYRNVPGTPEYPTTILAGSPTFTRDGDVDVVLGDQWEVDMGYVALGHTGFSGVITTTRNASSAAEGTDNWTGVDIDFQYDMGTGYNGVWLDARTPVNWTAITNTTDGVQLKFRFTGNSTQTNGQAITIHTTTTIADQIANYHPLDLLNLTLTGIPTGSIVVIYDDENPDPQDLGTELARSNSVTGGEFVFQFAETKAGDNVAIKVVNQPTYKLLDQLITLTANNATIPLTLTLETN